MSSIAGLMSHTEIGRHIALMLNACLLSGQIVRWSGAFLLTANVDEY